MEQELAERIIDEISDDGISERVLFHLMGEPLLHKNWFEIFSYAARKNLKIVLITNCSRLDNHVTEKLLSLDIEKIVLSLQTPTPETFKLRGARGLSFDECIKNIKRVIIGKLEKGSSTLLDIDLLNTSNRDLIDLRKDIRVVEDDETARMVVEYWTSFAEDLINRYNVQFSPLSSRQISSLSLKRGFNCEILPGVFISSRKATNWSNTITNSNRIIPGFIGGCDALKDQVGILWNGDLVLCCVDFDGKTTLGNVKDSSMVEILNSKFAEKIRKNFGRGILSHPYCRLCRGGTTLKTWLIRQIGSLIVYKFNYEYVDA
jgi:MoaA/NifB/PqqE/SkfB family radical SAM enzyme